jgi:precorrin-2 dehydrogenase/sirohydrochlorin ferrochelatase
VFGVFLNLADRLAVVIGGGSVGQRKARSLRESGARVRLVCLESRPDVDEQIEWLTEPYAARHLDGAALVIAAATKEVNARVVADARERGVWVCDAADPDNGDFVTPATIRRGTVVVAVSSGVPALTRRLRERLEDIVDPEYAQWAELLTRFRPRILREVPQTQRAALWEALTDESWLARLRAGDSVESEMEALLRRYEN